MLAMAVATAGCATGPAEARPQGCDEASAYSMTVGAGSSEPELPQAVEGREYRVRALSIGGGDRVTFLFDVTPPGAAPAYHKRLFSNLTPGTVAHFKPYQVKLTGVCGTRVTFDVAVVG